ncbi:MAG TPA: fatty acid desaturase family protein [Myxococcota bacterium]|nr:fatty acid desaturase family protein [Myxococcota bacterium]
MASASPALVKADWRAALSREEIAPLLVQSDLRSWISIGIDWGLVFASFALVAAWPHPFSIALALFLIGARQLGLAVLMHEAAHRTLLRDRRWNDWVGNWLCAYPVWSDITPYRPYHLQHHARTGTREDPDLGLIAPFPITRESLLRKVGRDLSGRTGWKFAKAAFARTFRRARQNEAARRAAVGVAVTNLVLLAGLTALGHPALYLLWAGAWLTTNTLVTRIRSIAEHALTPDAPEPRGRTRTTLARGWERLLIAPNRVNFHLEHHLVMTVPHYRLPALHRLLRARGVLDDACVERGYWRVLARAASKPAGGSSGEPDEQIPGPPVRVPPF